MCRSRLSPVAGGGIFSAQHMNDKQRLALHFCLYCVRRLSARGFQPAPRSRRVFSGHYQLLGATALLITPSGCFLRICFNFSSVKGRGNSLCNGSMEAHRVLQEGHCAEVWPGKGRAASRRAASSASNYVTLPSLQLAQVRAGFVF